MKKIGLLTFHDTANHGAALQAYATLKKVTSLGYNIELIDYSNSIRGALYDVRKKFVSEFKSCEFKSMLKTVVGSYPIYKRMTEFELFYGAYTPLSKDKYKNKMELEKANKTYDAFISGSDQVWSTKNNGNDSSYYLDFVQDKSRTMSYASSFGSTTNSNNELAPYKNALASIRHVGVRETKGVLIYDKLTDKKATLVLDPVFLLNAEQWRELIELDGSINSNSIGLIDYTSNKKYLNDFLALPGVSDHFKKITKFGTGISPRDIFDKNIKMKFSCGPQDFVASVYKGDFIFKSSFHGVVLSIIFRKQFVVALSGNEGRDSRLTSLLEQLGLQSRIMHSNMDLGSINLDIDYDTVHQKLDKLIGASVSFLDKSIKSILSEG